MPISVAPLDAIGAEVSGIDFRNAPSGEDAAEIVAAIDQHAVLVFRHDAALNDEQQTAFAAAFGPLQQLKMTKMLGKGKTRLNNPVLVDISNLDENGNIFGADDRRREFKMGNLTWHTDVSFADNRAVYSILSARVIPPDGSGDTDFADMRGAYDALTDEKKAELNGLKAEHSVWHSRALGGMDDVSDKEKAIWPPAAHDLVHANPRTGRKCLYLASHASHIVGWTEDKGKALLDELTDHATQLQFTYTHKWRDGDVVMWDNLATMHRGTKYDDHTHVRDMRRTTVMERDMVE
ncbi:uncharacterized protein METZ01_LOCUS81193 [marine metagenome]|jgi:alpha-ketoglutarate-dependent 2,4-dichlorophenoxyacetate dioxygenase|uniref:TauD/TfdA-like domain-containing protein n=1 Tax=marine metagenome TaxID=408172 RepID=A0A381UJL4_9ZZZZ